MVECIFLSYNNFSYSYILREECIKRKIYLELCRYVYEMLTKDKLNTAAILVDCSFEQAQENKVYYTEKLMQKMFILDKADNKIYSYSTGEYVCDNVVDFLSMPIFNPNLYIEKYPNARERVIEGIKDIGILPNKWPSLYIKELLCAMCEFEKPKVDYDLMKIVAARLEIPFKIVFNTLEYFFKPYIPIINQKTDNKIETYSAKKAINTLFDIIFNKNT